jgi:pyridoxamine 5'-phosphate oxidase
VRRRGGDPLLRLRRWLAAAERSGTPLVEAMALATAAPGGAPAVRFVLAKRIDETGVVFFTDSRSRKGRELRQNPRAALAVYWHPRRQVRVEGRIVGISPAEADRYWATRPRASRLAACASRQSAPLTQRRVLLARLADVRRRFRGRPVPRPPGWTGFRVVAASVEFWTRGAGRLHHRERFVRTSRGWRRMLLQP